MERKEEEALSGKVTKGLSCRRGLEMRTRSTRQRKVESPTRQAGAGKRQLARKQKKRARRDADSLRIGRSSSLTQEPSNKTVKGREGQTAQAKKITPRRRHKEPVQQKLNRRRNEPYSTEEKHFPSRGNSGRKEGEGAQGISR